jgi:hypothetical protein
VKRPNPPKLSRTPQKHKPHSPDPSRPRTSLLNSSPHCKCNQTSKSAPPMLPLPLPTPLPFHNVLTAIPSSHVEQASGLLVPGASGSGHPSFLHAIGRWTYVHE